MGLRRSFLDGKDIDPPALPIESYDPIGESEKRIVFASAHIATRMEMSAALAHDDATRSNSFTAIDFEAQSLTV
jgi:hypothetical protein